MGTNTTHIKSRNKIMKLIAHRGNIDGPSEMENHPDHIQKAFDAGFDVEVDVWMIDGDIFYGHDEPTYKGQLLDLDSRCWLHCKNLEALRFFASNVQINGTHSFWHNEDDFTLTNDRYIWTNIGKDLTKTSVMVMPEVDDQTLQNVVGVRCHGICSDHVNKIKGML
jgi:hypothetical protein